MAETPRWQLDRYGPVLRLEVRKLHLDPRLQRRFDSSDLVQETLGMAPGAWIAPACISFHTHTEGIVKRNGTW